MKLVIHTDEGFDVDFTIPVIFMLEFFYSNSYDECWWAHSLEKELNKMIDDKNHVKYFLHDKKIEFFLNMVCDWCSYSFHPVWHTHQVDIFSDSYIHDTIINIGGDESWE